MNPSPLEFARDFEKLKSDLARLPASDWRLGKLMQFWERLEPGVDSPSLSTWVEEFTDLLTGLTGEADLIDLLPDQLQRLRAILARLMESPSVATNREELTSAYRRAGVRLATRYFYVGATDQGLSVCAGQAGVGVPPLVEAELHGLSPLDALRTVYDTCRRDHPALGQILQTILAQWEEAALAVEHDRVWCLFVDKDGKGNVATGRMRRLRGTVECVVGKGVTPRGSSRSPRRVGVHLPPPNRRTQGPPLRDKESATGKDAALRARRGGDNTQTSRTVGTGLVAHHSWWEGQSHPKGRATHGDGRDSRTAESRDRFPPRAGAGPPSTADQVAFDNQVTAPADPFVGVAYQSLQAARLALQNSGFGHRARGSLRAYLSIDGAERSFTGDSIGLAVALVSFTQLLRPEVMRQERFIASDIAVTGSIEPDGRIQPVNDDTLAAKIERAFFSHVRYVVLPDANLAVASDTVKRMNKQYPRRRLGLVHASHLDEVVEDRNIIRSEKVCLGEFIVKKTARYSRLARVQVPLLAGLIWLLLAILWPKYFDPWFDWHIAEVVAKGNKIAALNSKGQRIFLSDNVGVTLKYEQDHVISPADRDFVIADVDNDGRDEVFLAVDNRKLPARIQLYDDDGTRKWEKLAFIPTSYPGDVETSRVKRSLSYGALSLREVVTSNGSRCAMASSFASAPARTQFVMFDGLGRVVSGPYLHTGAAFELGECLSLDINGNGVTEIIYQGYNNRLNRAVLLVLDPLRLSGVSPPFEGDLFEASRMAGGSHLVYIAFPPSPLSVDKQVYNSIREVFCGQEEGRYRVEVREGINFLAGEQSVKAQDAPVIYYDLDSNFVPIQVFWNDADERRVDDLLRRAGQPEIADHDGLLKTLRSEVIVYKGGRIVHYPAAGIDYYSDN